MVSSYERSLARAGTRKEMGAYYTPADVVDRVLDLCLEPVLRSARAGGTGALGSIRVLDPSCGTGNFLLAAAERIAAALHDSGMAPQRARRLAATECVVGIDLDAEAVRRCRATLSAMAGGEAVDGIVYGDALVGELPVRDGTFHVVVGNPPFLSQLGRATARAPEQTALLKQRLGEDVVGAYTDPAALFLARSVEWARPDGGVVALLEPQAALSAVDAGPVRARVLERAQLAALWSVGADVFDASVQVCVPVLRRGGDRRESAVALYAGRERVAAGRAPSPAAGDATWSSLLAVLAGVPARDLRTEGRIGDRAEATADFRDQYYGLAPHVLDRPDGDDDRWPRLVTTGLVDPAEVAWGVRDTTFNKTRYRHPRVDIGSLPDALRTWADRRRVPKVLVATQTRVVEAVVDARGGLLPSVPLVTVTAAGEDLWRVAAALSSPALTLQVLHRHLGSGRNPAAVRLRAADVVELALPGGHEAWADGCAALRAAHDAPDPEARRSRLRDVGRAMNHAYGLGDDEELLEWWLGRMPARHR